MRENLKITVIVVGIVAAFGIAGRIDYQDALADEARQSAELAKCLPRHWEVLQARWQEGKLQCETYPVRGAAYRNARTVDANQAVSRPTR